MRRILTISIFILGMFSSGCSKWLDVKPEDKFIEDEVYKHPQGFMDGLNGVYMSMGTNNMYGFQMTMGTTDLLAQYYFISTAQSQFRQQLIIYNFEDVSVRSQADLMWKSMFSTILSLNNFLENLETKGQVLDETSFALFKGEALALRAYLYLDLLRLFTPNYSIDPKAELIPYSDQAITAPSPYRTSEYVAEHILADLRLAEELLLKYDPAIQQTVVDQTTGVINVGPKPHLTYRNYRMNYYAVLALQARTYLWMGQKDNALLAAKKVIAQKSKFPWIKRAQLEDANSPNRIFSTEMIFGFENSKLYQAYDQNFSAKLEAQNSLFPGYSEEFLNKLYENSGTDFRLKYFWNKESEKDYKIFVKYKDLETISSKNYRYTVPGIGLSEIFLIAAECESDKNQALAYLNELRQNRDCLPIADETNLADDIMKEARREFYGLGQMWYFYKRQNSSRVFSASTLKDQEVVASDYVFPLPFSETEPR